MALKKHFLTVTATFEIERELDIPEDSEGLTLDEEKAIEADVSRALRGLRHTRSRPFISIDDIE